MVVALSVVHDEVSVNLAVRRVVNLIQRSTGPVDITHESNCGCSTQDVLPIEIAPEHGAVHIDFDAVLHGPT